jgi:hypothetical protein
MNRQPKFIDVMIKRIFLTSVGTTAARSMGKGIIENVRDFWRKQYPDFLKKMEAVKTQKQFQRLLNATTQQMCDQFPQSDAINGNRWGSARKFLNLLLRELLYNQFVSQHLQFNRFEDWLEVPLDSHVAEGINNDCNKHNFTHRFQLPKWDAIIRLDSETSEKYQTAALEIAAIKKTKRVHLDVFYWRNIGDEIN